MMKKIHYLLLLTTFFISNAQQYVGINTSNPLRELHVNGNMRVASIPQLSFLATTSYVGYEPLNNELVKYSDYNSRKMFTTNVIFRETTQSVLNFLTNMGTQIDPATKDNSTVFFGKISSLSNAPSSGSSTNLYNGSSYSAKFFYHKNSLGNYYARPGNTSLTNDANNDYIISYNEADDTHQIKNNFIFKAKFLVSLDFIPKTILVTPQLTDNYSDNLAVSVISYDMVTNELLLSVTRVDLRLNGWSVNHGYNLIFSN